MIDLYDNGVKEKNMKIYIWGFKADSLPNIVIPYLSKFGHILRQLEDLPV